ncbi:T9SS type A sorting domain-containing protein [Bacteroidales bacterium OttesenSCG-928-A17]|nr:T9SS type A sorting domain-containing protein [Bacteroidales bacterium OttesenSCG-928-A17]
MTKKNVAIVFLVLFSLQAWAASALTIVESKGWLESAYVKWEPVADAESYNVYYSGEGVTDKKIDDQLIRSYGSYFRADLLGLKAGTYTVKVAPVLASGEGDAATSEEITVLAHDRSGFAFTKNGEPGAYKPDGTLKSNAQVIYITANTAKTVTLDVIVDAKGTKETATGIYEILKKREKNKDHTPLAIRIVGKVTDKDVPAEVVSANYIDIKNTQNITLEGLGDDATLFGWGVHVRGANNIEVRNIGIMRFGDDGISLEVDNSNIWLHNNDLFYGSAGSDSDQAKGDGALDIKTSALVTVSYNHFWDSGKANLLGNGTESEEQLTYHHNWYDHSDSRHPRVRCHTVHVYNNYYKSIAKYGVGSTMGSSVFVEANYFENTKRPMLISMQGTDISGGKGTFSSENGGMIKAYNNYMDAFSQTSFKPWSETNSVEFDAYVVDSRGAAVPASVQAKQGKTSYNNFDTDVSMYSYTPDSPETAKEKVIQYAGRMFGGDFQPSDKLGSQSDSDKPIAALADAIDSYTSKLVSIQGDGSGNGNGNGNGNGDDGDDDDGGDDGDGDNIINGNEICTFDKTKTPSNPLFTAVGDNTTNKNGPVTVNGVSYTYAWKMNSKGIVTFSTQRSSTLILVFSSANEGNKFDVDGQIITIPADGIIKVTDLPAGAHELKRNSGESQLFYISVQLDAGSNINIPDKMSFHLYPNPVADLLRIDSDEEVQGVEVYTTNGSLVRYIKGSVSSVDMADLIPGSYIVRVQTADGTHGKLIIKE